MLSVPVTTLCELTLQIPQRVGRAPAPDAEKNQMLSSVQDCDSWNSVASV